MKAFSQHTQSTRRALLRKAAQGLLVFVSGLLLAPCSGCGQAEYEQRMQRRASQLGQSPRARDDGEPADEQADPLDE